MKYKIARKIFIVIFSFVTVLGVYSAEIGSISEAILVLREKAEIGVSYFITGDYEHAIVKLNETISFADKILETLSNEVGSSYESFSEEIIVLRPSKSELITSIRRYTTEAVKSYIVGKIDVTISRVIAIKNVIKIVLNKAVEARNFDKSKGAKGSYSFTDLEKRVLDEVKELGSSLYSTQLNVVSITNFVFETNIVVREENVFSRKYLVYIVATFGLLLVGVFIVLLRYRFVKKRIKDLSDLL